MKYWISWVQTSEDYRPLTAPPNGGIWGWWCSGETGEGDAILCAWVQADSKEEAEDVIYQDWPEAKEVEWRFFNSKPIGWKPSDRFPLSKWMRNRQ